MSRGIKTRGYDSPILPRFPGLERPEAENACELHFRLNLSILIDQTTVYANFANVRYL